MTPKHSKESADYLQRLVLAYHWDTSYPWLTNAWVKARAKSQQVQKRWVNL